MPITENPRPPTQSSDVCRVPGFILVVEDNDAIRRLTVVALQRSGYRTCEAADGSEALALMRRGGIDVIILDLAMPTISGWDLLAIRAGDAALRRVPVIVVSAVADLVDDGTLQREASAVLCKPFEPAVLQGIVASCLANANREEQHASS